MLSLDEWNVWYKAHTPETLRKPGWPKAPRLLEEIYNFEDALIIGGALITLLNNADRVKVACLAQLVNVIGAIFTDTGGPAWRQTIFHPFALASKHARGEVLRTRIETDTFATKRYPTAPLLVASVVHDPEAGSVSLFAMNRSTEEEMALSADLRGFGALALGDSFELHHDDLKAINDKAEERVKPVSHPAAAIEGQTLTARLKPLSWNIFTAKPPPR